MDYTNNKIESIREKAIRGKILSLDVVIEKGLSLNPGFKLQDYVTYIEAGKHRAILTKILLRDRNDSYRQRV